jgi:hypothetical protein
VGECVCECCVRVALVGGREVQRHSDGMSNSGNSVVGCCHRVYRAWKDERKREKTNKIGSNPSEIEVF